MDLMVILELAHAKGHISDEDVEALVEILKRARSEFMEEFARDGSAVANACASKLHEMIRAGS